MVEEHKYKMKWLVTIVASILLVYSTIVRASQGLEADITLCGVFVSVSGLVWGANIVDKLKKK